MSASGRPLALVTGASAGIGYELAKQCIDLVIASDQPEIRHAASEFRSLGADVTEVQVDLATIEGVDELIDAAASKSS
jgi:NAD(P)-dependent dehydrogenase (short-subunit alcohol dehydrogenase family)